MVDLNKAQKELTPAEFDKLLAGVVEAKMVAKIKQEVKKPVAKPSEKDKKAK